MAQLLGVDPRGLALLRVGLAVCILVDLAARATDLYAHYTDYGVLARFELLRAFAWLHEGPLSLHLASGSVESQAAIFLLHVATAIALLLGYRARAATILAWFLLSSVQLRNPLIGGGYDAALRMILFWSCFLPLGAYFSLDNVRAGVASARPRMVLSAGTVALLVQLVIVYWAAGYAKATQAIWLDGEALGSILHDDFFATAFGRWLGQYAGLSSILTRAIVVVELGGPLLLICSGWSAPLRTAAIAVVCAMNLLFALTLDLWLLPWVMSIGLLTFLPPSFWNRASRWRFVSAAKRRAAANTAWQRVVNWVGSRESRALPDGTGLPQQNDAQTMSPLFSDRSRLAARAALCAILLVAVIHWNFGVARDRGYVAPWYTSWILSPLFLQQDWRMFADPSARTGWIVIPARLADGREVDLMAAGGRVPRLEDYRYGETIDWTKPPSVLGHYANVRWRALFRHVIIGDTEPSAALLYGRYLCREWNSRYRGDDQLARFQVTFVSALLRPPYEALSYNPEVVWTHDCFQ